VTRALVIPAAGAGTRLGSDRPKALTLVAGRPMLDWLLERYAPFVSRVVVVASPAAASEMRAHLAAQKLPSAVAVQPRATGMLDAIRLAEPALREGGGAFGSDPKGPLPRWVWITWCDQVAVSAATAQRLARECDAADERTAAVMPTVPRAAPYIHLARDAEGRIARILQAREGDAMPAHGESDMGLFALSRLAFFELLPQFDAEDAARGTGTGERNFLPFLAWLRGRGEVRTFSVPSEIEAIGVNTRDELARVESHLLSRAAGGER
jgi:bifunctional N-acetylglucosamine-1-phosphate-uridyltransferase/glucosamine-1-phosphate-acetyltransferase GlmU-like protein